jgi:hypothetical protein
MIPPFSQVEECILEEFSPNGVYQEFFLDSVSPVIED